MEKHILDCLRSGVVIPAHPLALTKGRRLDEFRQRRLTRYYMAAGAGGVAVGVHTTQFAIRDPRVGLYEPVLRMAAEEVAAAGLERPFIKIAGVCGATRQATGEASVAAGYGYDLALLSLGGLDDWDEGRLLDHVRAVGDVIPVVGFYLQPAVGGRVLSYRFWRSFAEIPAVKAIKVAAFNRYQTLDVVRAVCASSRRDDITLYTGNDDNIVADLLTSYCCVVEGRPVQKGFAGGLLGHWAVWTAGAVRLFTAIKELRQGPGAADLRQANEGEVRRGSGAGNVRDWLSVGISVTDMNAALFDVANGFSGCIAGIHEILRRQGLLEGRWCLDPEEDLSPGQAEELERVCRDYPHLTDDAFVHQFLSNEK
ncbi:MAG: dihydrodipicolinate synthase family protein [Bacteroidetes bacterium]|nr:dihydrodipicolinate synthase family protein [Bacteroidota bacterium]